MRIRFRRRDDKYVLVQQVGLLGYRIMGTFDAYSDAYDYRSRMTDVLNTRIMTMSTWERETLRINRSPQKWAALAGLVTRMDRTESTIRDLEAIQQSKFLEAFQEAKHP